MKGPMRVAHVVVSSGAAGVESYLITLLSSLDRSEVEPVLFGPGPGILVDRLEALGVKVESGAPTRKLDLGATRRLAGRWAGRFDLVHAHGPRALFWALRAARRVAIPVIATVHELRWRSMPPGLRRELWIALEAHAMHGAARLVTLSEAARRDLVGRFPRLAARAVCVHASTPMLREADRLPRAAPGECADGLFRLVTVGRLSWPKGYDLLLAAMDVLARRGVDFVLDIVGTGEEEARLRARAARLGLERRLRWLGGDVDLPRLLASAHAFVAATRAETFGIAVLEAMAIGLPVLAPAVGGLAEVAADGETGVLVPFSPVVTLPARLAEVLVRWQANPGERARLGANGRARARGRFGPAAMARGVTEVYRLALAESRA